MRLLAETAYHTRGIQLQGKEPWYTAFLKQPHNYTTLGFIEKLGTTRPVLNLEGFQEFLEKYSFQNTVCTICA